MKNLAAMLFATVVSAPALAADIRDLMIPLDNALRMACGDVVGVSVGNPADKSTWRIDFAVQNSLCTADAEKVVADFDIRDFEPSAIKN